MKMHVFAWCVVATEEGEKYVLLFMQFLPLDISACVVVGDQILRDRVWQVQQSRFTAGTFSLHNNMADHNSVNRSAPFFPGHGPD